MPDMTANERELSGKLLRLQAEVLTLREDLQLIQNDIRMVRESILRRPGYMHWNKKFDAEYFKQLLTSERHKWVKGVKVYEKISSASRNEALDLNVYSLAAFELARPLIPVRQAQIAEAKKQWEKEREKESGVRSQDTESVAIAQQKRVTMPQGKKNWVTDWRR